MTFEEFMGHADDAVYMSNVDLLRGYAKEVFNELDRLRAEVAETRGTSDGRGVLGAAPHPCRVDTSQT